MRVKTFQHIGPAHIRTHTLIDASARKSSRAQAIAGIAISAVALVAISCFIKWGLYQHILLRTLATATTCALIATIAGLALALVPILFARGAAIIPFVILPLLAPSVALATAVTNLPIIPANWHSPYNPALIAASIVISGISIAFLVHLFFLRRAARRISVATASMHAPKRRVIKTIVVPHLAASSLISFLLVGLWAANDTSAALAYGSATPLLGTAGSQALALGSDYAWQIIALSAALALAVALGLIAVTAASNGGTIHALTASALPHYLAQRGSERAFISLSAPLWLKAIAASSAVLYCIGFGIGGIAALRLMADSRILGFNADSTLGISFGQSAADLFNSLGVAAVAVLIGLALGLAAALHEWKYPLLVTGAVAFAGLFSLEGGGMLVYIMHSEAVRIGTVTVLPALVGAESAGHGMFALIGVYVPITFAVAYFAAQALAAPLHQLIASARELGAPRLRVLFLVLIELRFEGLALSAAMGAWIITQNAPALYVRPDDVQLISSSLISYSEGALDAEVLAGGTLCASAAGALAIVAIALMKYSRRRRVWRSK